MDIGSEDAAIDIFIVKICKDSTTQRMIKPWKYTDHGSSCVIIQRRLKNEIIEMVV